MELLLLALIDAEYTRHPFYGSRKMVVHLATKGHPVNRKRVQRLMGVLSKQRGQALKREKGDIIYS